MATITGDRTAERVSLNVGGQGLSSDHDFEVSKPACWWFSN